MADEAKKSNLLLFGILAAGGAYLLYKQSSSNTTSSTTTAATAATPASSWDTSVPTTATTSVQLPASTPAPTSTLPSFLTQLIPSLATAAAAAPATAPVTASATAGMSSTVVDQYGMPHMNPLPAVFDLPTPHQAEIFKAWSDTYGMYYEEVERVQTYIYYKSYGSTPYGDFLGTMSQAVQSGQVRSWIADYNSANPSSRVSPRR